MLKKLLSIVAAAIMGACLFCGCGDLTDDLDEQNKGFYSLGEAYDNGWLTKMDIQSVANKVNNFVADNICDLDNKILEEVKQTYFEQLKNSINKETGLSRYPNAKEEDISTILYYGKFNECYCFRIWHPYVVYPDVVLEEIVADEALFYSGPNVEVYKS